MSESQTLIRIVFCKIYLTLDHVGTSQEIFSCPWEQNVLSLGLGLPVANGGCLLFTNLLFKVQIISYVVKLLILFKLHM